MAKKKVFYTKEKYRAPKELQTYVVLSILAFFIGLLTYFSGLEGSQITSENQFEPKGQFSEIRQPRSLSKYDWSDDLDAVLDYQSVLSRIAPSNFIVGLQRAKDEDSCLIMKWLPKNSDSSPKLIVPYGRTDQWQLTELATSLAKISSQLTTPVEFIFYNLASECSYEESQFSRSEEDLSKPKIFLASHGFDNRDRILDSTSLNEYPSPHWGKIFAELQPGDNSFTQYFFPVPSEYSRHHDYENSLLLNLYERANPEEKNFLFYSLAKALEKITQNQDLLSSSFYAGIWLTSNQTLSGWSSIAAWFLCLLLLISPILNRAVLKKEAPDIITGVISAIYFSITPIVVATAILLSDYWSFYNQSTMTTILIVGALIAMFQRNLAFSSLSIFTNSSSAILTAILFAAILSIFDGFHLLIWTPFIFLNSAYKQTRKILRPVLVLVSFVPIGLIFANMEGQLLMNTYLSIAGFSRMIHTNPMQATVYILFIGSLLSLIFPAREIR